MKRALAAAVVLVLASPVAAQVTGPSGTLPTTPSPRVTAPPPGTPSTVPEQISPRSPTEPMPSPTLDRIEPRAGSIDEQDRPRGPSVPDYRPPASRDPSGLTRSPYAPPSIDGGR